MSAQPTPRLLESPSGLRVQLNANGSVRRIDHGDILLNLFLGSEMEGGPANLYLRRHAARIEWTPLLGPRSPAVMRFDERGFVAHGEWQRIRFRISLVLASSAPAWFWHVAIENIGPTRQTVDLIHAQDLALAHYGAGIAVRLIRECLLGVRQARSRLTLDPVLPRSLDGLRVRLKLAGRDVELVYRTGALGCGPTSLALNGRPLAFEREHNPYRTGGAEVSMEAFRERLGDGRNQLVVELG